MPKNPVKQNQKRKIQEEVVAILAEKHRVSNRFVQMVISGDRKNLAILEDYISYKEEHNLLLKAVEKSVPFYN